MALLKVELQTLVVEEEVVIILQGLRFLVNLVDLVSSS
jgi:hypothetical protein